MILRLIDIVLIVLFGFITLATIENQRKLVLSETSAVRAADIGAAGSITVSVDVWGDVFFQDEREPWSMNQIEDRLIQLRRTPAFSDSMHVRIRADEGAPMGSVKDVIQMVDGHNLARSLIVIFTDTQP